MRKSTFNPTAWLVTALLTAGALLAAGSLTGCESGDSATNSPVLGTGPGSNPCQVFDEAIAEGLGNGPYLPGQASTSGSSTTCYRPPDPKAPNLHGATARFERMSKPEFLARACAAPVNPETGRPLYEVEFLSGYYEAACRFMPFGEGKVGLNILTASGWAVMVGSAPEADCRAAIEKLVPKLPR